MDSVMLMAYIAEKQPAGVGGEGSTRVGPPPRVGSSVRGNSHTEEGKEVPPGNPLKTNRRPSYWGNVPAHLCKC